VAAVNRLEHFRSSVSAKWATHRVFLLSVNAGPHPTLKALRWSMQLRGNSGVFVKNAAEFTTGEDAAIKRQENSGQARREKTKS